MEGVEPGSINGGERRFRSDNGGGAGKSRRFWQPAGRRARPHQGSYRLDEAPKRGRSLRSRPMKAVILAGGRGSRLSEETIERPKPMAEIGGEPNLWHILKLYSAHGGD